MRPTQIAKLPKNKTKQNKQNLTSEALSTKIQNLRPNQIAGKKKNTTGYAHS